MRNILPILGLTLTLFACGEEKNAEDTGGFALGNTQNDADADTDADADADADNNNAPPTLSILEPDAGEVFDVGEDVTFIAEVSDDHDQPHMLALLWKSDSDGDLDSDPCDGDGRAELRTDDLSEGRHIISLEATDSEGELATATVVITVEADADTDADADADADADSDTDSDQDRDEDGWTRDEGDCDDDDIYIYPGAPEYCDGVDSNCDGYADIEYWDDQEPNEVLGSATELGEVDEDWFSWGTATVTVDGLNFDSEHDEDWFKWDADDDWWDDVDVFVEVEGAGDQYFVVELWLLDFDTTTVVEEDEGFGSVRLEYDGYITSSDEDNWAVRIRPSGDEYDDETCASDYMVTIGS